MKLRSEQLNPHLQKTLAPLYLIAGNEPLLVQEAEDTLRQYARKAGFDWRQVIHVDTGFDWDNLLLETQNLSLFTEKKLIELRMPSGKPGDRGASILQSYAAKPEADILLIITTGKLDSSTQNTAWFKAVERAGVIVQIWPVDAEALPHFIKQRLHQAGIETSLEGIKLLAHYVEGNLLAATQEIEKLLLIYGKGKISAEQIAHAIFDHARFDVFTLVDAILQADAKRIVRILSGLKTEGIEPILVLWAITRQLRELIELALPPQHTSSSSNTRQYQRVFPKRQALLQQAARRYPAKKWQQLLQQAALIDRMLKGMEPGNPWDALLGLSLKMGLA